MKIVDGVVHLSSILEPLDWSAIFPQQQPIVLDLGAGDGGFAAAYAAQKPNYNLLAVERLLGRVRKISRKSVRLNLTNLRVARIESSYLLKYLVPSHSIQEIHVLFPDPWPKKRHQERRIIQPTFLETVVQTLTPTGLFRFTTDHEEYFHSALPHLEACAGLKRAHQPEVYPMTDFEKQFRTENKPIYNSVWLRRS